MKYNAMQRGTEINDKLRQLKQLKYKQLKTNFLPM